MGVNFCGGILYVSWGVFCMWYGGHFVCDGRGILYVGRSIFRQSGDDFSVSRS